MKTVRDFWAGNIFHTLWEKRFAFFPRRCHVSKKLIWFKYGYCTTYYLFERKCASYWRTSEIHLIETLKGNTSPINLDVPLPPFPPRPPAPRGQSVMKI